MGGCQGGTRAQAEGMSAASPTGQKTQTKTKPQPKKKEKHTQKNPTKLPKNHLLMMGEPQSPTCRGAGEQVTQKYVCVVENEVTAGSCHPHGWPEGSSHSTGAQPSQPQPPRTPAGFARSFPGRRGRDREALSREGPSATVRPRWPLGNPMASGQRGSRWGAGGGCVCFIPSLQHPA